MAEWDAEVEIDEALVRALLGEQFPELDASSARLLGEGWDNAVWVVEETWAFRFPRREIAIPGVERELAVLPRLAPLLPTPIPEPRFVGVASARFAWPFFGAPLLSGREAADAGISDHDRIELGAELGRFLRVLHDLELDVELPLDPLGRADMAIRLSRVRTNLSNLRELGLWDAPARLDDVLSVAGALPPSTAAAVFCHGDLHQRHVLVAGPALTAVIDWGDMCRADPCIDLIPYWSMLDRPGRVRFLAEYGVPGADQLLRARVLALTLDSMLARYAVDQGHSGLRREAIAALERALVD